MILRKLFTRKKHFHVFAVLVLPDGQRLNYESVASTDAPYLNRGWLKERIIKTADMPDGTVVIFTSIVQISKKQFGFWTNDMGEAEL